MDTGRWFVGVDWATEAHQVCVLSATGDVVGERRIPHSGIGLHALVTWLRALTDDQLAAVSVAIEVPRGGVVETLLGHGLHVAHCNPKQLDRFRDRITVAGAKDDRRDAWVLASALRTDPHCFHVVSAEDPQIIQLREVARAEADLREEANRLTNRVREQLLRYYPALLTLCPAMDAPWVWALWELAPTPAAAGTLRLSRVATLLKTHRIRRVDAPAVLAALRVPPLTVAPGTAEAAQTHLQLLIARLRLVAVQRDACARACAALLEALDTPPSPPPATNAAPARPSDVRILRSLPGVGRIVAATLLSDAAVALQDRNYAALRAFSGVAPITKQSGKRRVVSMRYACSARLRMALYHWARVSTQCDAVAKAYYARLRARGQTHGRALRSVADRWLRILMAMLTTGALYDPAHPRAGTPALTPPQHP
ncbi:MAG: IS110 family transposase [Gemmatimonadaceae bacterium]|jgi:transposase|nr:IS110 family transposase [Gemmatimonadaceae bacterium]